MNRIVKGVQEAVAHANGVGPGTTRTVMVPDLAAEAKRKEDLTTLIINVGMLRRDVASDIAKAILAKWVMIDCPAPQTSAVPGMPKITRLSRA